MSAAQVHPEELLDRARRDGLDTDEWRLLQSHLARCPACRFELSLAPALYAHIALGAEDQDMLARAIAKTRRAPRYQARERRRNKMMPAVAMVAVVLLAGVAMASAGAYVWRRHSIAPLDTPSLSPHAPRQQRQDHLRSPPLTTPTPTPTPPPTPVQAMDAPAAATTPAPAEAAARATTTHARRVASTAGANRCADRFRRANESRRAGAFGEAVRLYQALRLACAGTSEELSSRVLAGRIYLDRLAEPMLALAAFDSYLATTSSGALREEAMIGRALALGRVNRPADEARAWQALLSAYPDSLYAGKAAARLNGPR